MIIWIEWHTIDGIDDAIIVDNGEGNLRGFCRSCDIKVFYIRDKVQLLVELCNGEE